LIVNTDHIITVSKIKAAGWGATLDRHPGDIVTEPRINGLITHKLNGYMDCPKMDDVYRLHILDEVYQPVVRVPDVRVLFNQSQG